jgi:hypothetical protein
LKKARQQLEEQKKLGDEIIECNEQLKEELKISKILKDAGPEMISMGT